ncbi:hypothetical protein A5621_10660 [Mycobacterium colombiense]|nr:hypothetical protein A5621_10660 [Mycobacterium colombiense]OBJ76046.1 hypothetical protein A5627_01555 [Mycobacterium colombiense]
MMCATCSGAGAGRAVRGWRATARSLMSMTIRSWALSLSASAATVTAAIGAVSVSMNSMRAAGSAGSIGR